MGSPFPILDADFIEADTDDDSADLQAALGTSHPDTLTLE